MPLLLFLLEATLKSHSKTKSQYRFFVNKLCPLRATNNSPASVISQPPFEAGTVHASRPLPSKSVSHFSLAFIDSPGIECEVHPAISTQPSDKINQCFISQSS